MAEPPPPHVLAAFGVTEATPLPGGRGRSWRAGQLVLKPLDRRPEQLAWEAELFAAIVEDGFRIAHPLPAVVDGWTASQFVAGEHLPGRWREIVAVGERLHAALAGVPRPAILDGLTDPWSRADRVAWGEEPFSALDDVLRALEPVDGTPQLVHSDLTGNVLFHPTLPPAIIDFSPYWRPPEFASAVVVADAICWEGAPADLAELVHPQYLLRALVFRAVTTLLFGGGEDVPEIELARRIAACASR